MAKTTKLAELNETELDTAAAAGHSRCEHDDGRGTGGSGGSGGSGSGGSSVRHTPINQLTSYIDAS